MNSRRLFWANLILADSWDLIEAALNSYWGGKRCHFNKTYDIREMLKDSKVLQTLKKEESNLPFMV